MKRVIACIDNSPCLDAIVKAAFWVAQTTGRQLHLLHVVDYYPSSYHLGEMAGVVGFESNAILLKELAEIEHKQSQLAQALSEQLLQHLVEQIQSKYQLQPTVLQAKGDFLEQSLKLLNNDDVVILGRRGEHAVQRNKPIGSNVENFIRSAPCSVLTVGEQFEIPQNFMFAYEYSATCQALLQRLCKSDLLKNLPCHLVYVGNLIDILQQPQQQLSDAGFSVQATYAYGDVADNLLYYQKEYALDLILMGAFSHSKIHQLFLGSVATQVYRQATVPLLMVK